MSDRPPFPLTLRVATEADATLLLGWRNDPNVRAASRTTHEIGLAEHAEWLRGVLAAPDRDLLIAELDGRPVGQLRLDACGCREYEVSISVAAASRGEGISTRLIEAGMRRLAASRARGSVVAYVRVENQRSLRAFVAAGFTRDDGTDREGFARLTRGLEPR
jgi:RimJ/RimL family protein N-acetyltransferase